MASLLKAGQMSKINRSNAPNGTNRSESHTENEAPLSNQKIATFTSLRIRNFRFLLTGTVLSNASMWIQQVTLSWLVYYLTGSGTILGSLNMVRSFAALGMVPAAGLLIDRYNRRNLLLLTNGWFFVLNFVLGLGLILGYSNMVFLFLFSFLGGLAQTIDYSLRQVVVFDLVPRQITPNAVAMVQTGWSLMRSFGPGIGGFLILWIGAGGNFLVQAAAYALISITVLNIQFPERTRGILKTSPFENIRESIRFILREPDTRVFMLLGLILPFFIIPTFHILPPIYAKDVFHGGSDILGILMSSVGVGGIMGGFATASLGRIERRGMLQIGALFLVTLFLIGFGFCTKLWIALFFLVFAGFFEMIFLATNQTLLQLSIPDHLRGRVTSIINVNMSLAPLGGMIAGIGSDLFGGPKMITIIMNGVAAGITALIFFASPSVRKYRMSEAIKQK
jgi:MFS family permease